MYFQRRLLFKKYKKKSVISVWTNGFTPTDQILWQNSRSKNSEKKLNDFILCHRNMSGLPYCVKCLRQFSTRLFLKLQFSRPFGVVDVSRSDVKYMFINFKEVACGGLKENDLFASYAWMLSPWFVKMNCLGRIWRCDLAVGDVALKEICQGGWGYFLGFKSPCYPN